jgi:hypothetical protein
MIWFLLKRRSAPTVLRRRGSFQNGPGHGDVLCGDAGEIGNGDVFRRAASRCRSC